MFRRLRFWACSCVVDAFVIIVVGGWLLGVDLWLAVLLWAMFGAISAGGVYVLWLVGQNELRKAGWKW